MKRRKHISNSGECEAGRVSSIINERAIISKTKFPKIFEHDTKQQKEGERGRLFTLAFHLHLIGVGGGCEVENVGTASTLQRPEDF